MTQTGPTDSRSASEQQAYDAVPYARSVFPNTHPDHLESVAALFHLASVDATKARILEIGCAHGSNLIPMAVELPESTFVGIDLSPIQIAKAKDEILALGLTNIRVEQMNILDLDRSFGTFDYIIAHGIYSWVPRAVREGMLAAMKSMLAETGVIYMSYNTNPGWKVRGVVRDLMLFHTRGIAEIPVKLQQSRAIVEFVANVARADTPYASLLKHESDQMRVWPDDYMFHDALEGTNDAFYFTEVIEQTSAQGLSYLGDAELFSMFKSNFPDEVQQFLAPIGSDTIATEQYLDFVRNRTFRQSLFVHDSATYSRQIAPEDVYGFLISARLNPEDPNLDILSGEPVRFVSSNDRSVVTTKPIVKAALMVLRENWSQAISFDSLLDLSLALLDRISLKTGGVRPPAFDRPLLARELAEVLLYFLSTDAVKFHRHPYPFTLSISQRPIASPLARWEATQGTVVTNLRHEHLDVGFLSAAVLTMLDGSRDRDAIAVGLFQLSSSGAIRIDLEGVSIDRLPDPLKILLPEVDRALQSIARGGLLVA